MSAGKAIGALGALAVIGAVGAFGAYQWSIGAVSSDEVLQPFEVPKGASAIRVGKLLHTAKLIRSPHGWRVYLRMTGPADIKAGEHQLSPSMDVAAILTALQKAPLAEERPLTMVEGWRLIDADIWLANKGFIERGAYVEAASKPERFDVPYKIEGSTLEGYLLPETYAVPMGTLDVDKLIQRQIDGFDQRFVKPHADAIAKSGRTLHQLVVLASMLEREEPKIANRNMVAGVMYKRLDARTPLGIDATSRYLLDDWSDRRKFLAKLRDKSDPYNTRLKTGLPPTAIGAPSLPSLLAALNPTKSEYWYYLHDHDQNIHFAKSAAGHEANRRKYNVY